MNGIQQKCESLSEESWSRLKVEKAALFVGRAWQESSLSRSDAGEGLKRSMQF